MTETLPNETRSEDLRGPSRSAVRLVLKIVAPPLAVLAFTLLRFTLTPLVGTLAPYVVFYFPIMFISYFLGVWPGLATTLIATLVGKYFFMEHIGSFRYADTREMILTGLFACVALFLNITAGRLRSTQKKLRAALVHSDQLGSEFASLFELSGSGKGQCDPRTGRYLRVNRKLREITGYTQAEMLTMTFRDVTHPQDQRRDDLIYASAVHGTAPDEWTNEKRYVRKDGAIIWVNVTGSVVRDEQGKLLYTLATVSDITAQREANERLKESEERFRALASTLPQVVWMTDSVGKNIYTNDRWQEVFGEATPGNWLELVHPEDRMALVDAHQLAFISGEPLAGVEFRVRTKDGDYRWYLSGALPQKDDEGRAVRWVGSSTDIQSQKEVETELREAKASAERAGNAKMQFLANMSHEIRTPMNAILGFTDLLTDTSDALERDAYVGRIQANSHHLLRIIDDILDLSKLEAGALQIQMAEFSPRDLVADVASMMGPLAAANGVNMTTEVKPDLPARVQGDATRLRQILVNLLGNSVKFTAQGSISLRVRREDASLVYELRDTGIGIGTTARDRLFKPFSQEDESITRRYGGTGLGLALSRSLAQAMGGDLSLAWSEPGVGTKFILRLPERRVDVGASASAERAATRALSVAAGRLSHLKILVAEDAPDGRALMDVYLKKEGTVAEFATNGREAFEKARRGDFDVVLMDIQMPDLDGLQATKKLRALGFRAPIIALTAHAMREEVDRSHAAGCDAHLAKPVSRRDLVEAILRFTSRQREPEAPL